MCRGGHPHSNSTVRKIPHCGTHCAFCADCALAQFRTAQLCVRTVVPHNCAGAKLWCALFEVTFISSYHWKIFILIKVWICIYPHNFPHIFPHTAQNAHVRQIVPPPVRAHVRMCGLPTSSWGVCIGYGWRLRLSLGWSEVEMSWSWGRCRIWGECG